MKRLILLALLALSGLAGSLPTQTAAAGREVRETFTATFDYVS